jgi:O-antigen/teichoic acid export membrane protein
MSTSARVIKNSTSTFVSQLFGNGLRAIYVVLVGRFLSPADFGFYSFANAICLALTILATMGLETIIVREIARLRIGGPDPHGCSEPHDSSAATHRQRTILGSVLFYEACFAVPVLVLLALIATWRGYTDQRYTAFLLLGGGLVFRQFSDSLIGVLRGHEHMEYEMVFSVVEGVGLVGLFLLFRLLDVGFIGVFAAYALTYVLQFIVGLLFVVRVFFKPSFASVSQDFKLIGKAFPVGIARFTNSLNTNSGPLLLPILRNEMEAGIYGAAYQPLKGLFLFTRSLGVGVLPVFSQLYGQQDSGRLGSSAGNSLRFTTIIVLPLAMSLFAFPEFALRLLYGTKYMSGAPVLRILSIVILLTFLNSLLSQLLVAMERQEVVGWGRTAATVVNLGLLFWLTPLWGPIGPAVSLLGGEVLLFAVVLAYLALHFQRLPLHRALSRPTLASLSMVGVFGLGYRGSPWLVIPLALVAYLGALILVGGLVRSDLRLLRMLRDRAAGLWHRARSWRAMIRRDKP